MKSKAELFAELDVLKARLDAHRPLPADVVSQIRDDMRIRFTYHSNAIEGNTLTMSETKAVLEDGITIGGKSLKEHLEAVGHSHAIGYMEALVQRDEALTERTLKEIHNLILRNIDGANAGTYRRMNVLISGAGHIPPPAERVPEKMEAFFRWYGAARGYAASCGIWGPRPFGFREHPSLQGWKWQNGPAHHELRAHAGWLSHGDSPRGCAPGLLPKFGYRRHAGGLSPLRDANH